MKLFSGTSNKALAQEIASILGATLGDVEITRFIDNECRVFVKEDVVGEDVYVVQSLSQVADQHLVELCLLGTALHDLGAASITAVIPWMGYSKQDKAFRKGEAISASLVAKFIEVAGFDRVLTCQLHSENVLPYFNIPVEEIHTESLFVNFLKDTPYLVISPDTGGAHRSEAFAAATKRDIVYLTKTRDLHTGMVAITGVRGKVAGHDCVLYDDIINSGATVIKASEFLRSHGAGHISVIATHGVLAGDAIKQLATSAIDTIVLTNTIALPPASLLAKCHVLSVAPLLASAIIQK